ncbi:MAG: phage tail tape measure protein [Hominenteromicrobium sp.]|uniref:phage tail tape measure protein n=1 Tax=Hominenteromicrobium sp. TaxID=3073581 RepID=UPI00399B2C31
MAGKTLQSTIEIAGTLSPSLQQAIKQAIDRLEEMSQETLESAGAAAKLAAEISTQESVLKNLQRGYEDYIVSGSESTDEALKLADTIQDLSNELNENRGALEAAHEAAQKLAGGQQETADAYSKLQKQIGEQEAELATLRRSYANVALEQGETSAEARQLASQISQLSGDLNENRQRLSAAEQAADQLGNSLEDAGQDAESSSEGYTVLKNVLANLVTEGINKTVDAFKELATEGDTSLAMLSARTGATAQELEGFEDVMYEVYNSNYGDSLGDVSEKLSTVIQMTDNLDKASLAQITKNAIALEDVFGFDVVESLRTANSLTDQFGISAEEAFNLIVQGAQKGLNQNDDLLDTINEYSVQFRNAGYSADDMFNMLANGAETGTWSIDKLGDAVKEFNIRMSDGTANEYLEQLGLNTEEVIAQFNKGGPEAQAAIGDIMEALQECDDATLQYQAGVGLFGTMWEDLGVDTVASLMDTQGAIQSTSDAMAQLDSAAYDTLESSLSQLGRTIKSEVVQPVAEELTPAMKEAVDYVNANVAPAVDWVSSHLPEIGLALGTLSAVLVAMNWGSLVAQFGKIKGAITGFTTALGAVSGPVMAVIAIVAALAAGFMYLWQTNEDFRANVTAIWAELQASFSELGAGIMQMINQLMPLIQQTAATVLSAFAQIASAVIPVLVEFINALLPVLTQIVQAILPVFVQLISALLPILSQIVTAIMPVIIQLLNTILPIIMQIIQAVLPILIQILNMLTPILNMIVSLLTPILNLIISLVEPILNLIMSAITPLINIFMSLINTVLQPIMPILQALANIFTAVLGAAIQAIQPIVQSLISIFQGLINFITGVFSGSWSSAWSGVVQVFGGLWDGLVGLVKAPINAVIGLVNSAINALNGISVTIPDWVPVVGGNTFGINIPNIPMLATGGFTDGVSIAGEEGMEAVISFDPAYRDQNIAIWQKAGQLLGTLGSSSEGGAGLTNTAGKLLALDDFSLGSLANNTSTVIYYDFSGFTWSPQIQTEGSGEDADDFMARLKAHEAEFFDWLEEFIQAREVALYA